MDIAPPSYQIAIARDPWSHIAQYVSLTSLAALALLNRGLNQKVSPVLWGDPFIHFARHTNPTYMDHGTKAATAFLNFLSSLPTVRLAIRELTHTLRVPNLRTDELYDKPDSRWLRIALENLPKLQSVLVTTNDDLDHASLCAVPVEALARRSATSRSSPWPLRLLSATSCFNATSEGMAAALQVFSKIIYLDLSNTPASRNSLVLQTLEQLPCLQSLKLCGLHLRDDDMCTLADAIGRQVRSLDVRNNLLTDRSLQVLRHRCFLHGTPIVPLNILDDKILLQDSRHDRMLYQILTSKVISAPPSENCSPSGITHLYMAGNQLSVSGELELLQEQSLYVLDIGYYNRKKIRAGLSRNHDASISYDRIAAKLSAIALPMTYLRIEYSVIAKLQPSAKRTAPKVGQTPVINTSQMSSQPLLLHKESPPAYEMSSDQTNWSRESRAQENDRSISAPQIGLNVAVSGDAAYDRELDDIRVRRQALRAPKSDSKLLLQPGNLPKLRTLILTNIPRSDDDNAIAHSLIELINICAQESDLARKEAVISLQSGAQSGNSAKKITQYAESIFGLQEIILEMESSITQEDSVITIERADDSHHMNEERRYMKEDADISRLKLAAQNDFSFFPDDEHDQQSRTDMDDANFTQSAKVTARFTVVNEISKYRNEQKLAIEKSLKAEPGRDPSAEANLYWSGRITVVNI